MVAWRQVAVVLMLCPFSLVDRSCCAALVLFRCRSPLIHPTHTNKWNFLGLWFYLSGQNHLSKRLVWLVQQD